MDRRGARGPAGSPLAPGVGLPEATVDRALRGLDAYAASWTTTRTAACTDSQQGVRSHDTLDLRMRCLDRRLAELSGLLEGLAAGGPEALRATSDAVAQLRPATGCAEAKEVDVRPASAALRAELDAAEGNVARATALLSLGQFERALPLVERAVVAGEHANDGSLIARALVIRGECEDRLGKYADALATYQRAAKSAATAQDHGVMADALTRAFLVEGDHLGRRADALRNQPYVELALASAGQPDAVRAEWLHYLAILLYEDGARVDDAAVYEREALAIRQRTLPPGHMYLIDSIETLANIEGVRNNFDESTRLLNQVVEARVAARGPNDAMVSGAYNNLGVLEIRRGRLPAAVGYLQRAVVIAHASGKPNTAAEFNVGILQLELGRWTAAAKTFAASLETSERVAGKQSRDAAESAMFLAVAWIAAGEFERARPMLQRSIDDARRAGSPSLVTALTHAARLALHDGDLARAHALLDEANALPPANGALRRLAAAEIARAEAGCRAARPLLVETLADALEHERHMVRSLATVELAECEGAAGDVRAARDRLEAELAWLTSAGADDLAAAPARDALAKLRR